MALIFVTGPTCSGKSTIRKELRSRGYEAHDTDEDKISRHYNRETGEVAKYPNDLERPENWHQEHSFRMSPDEIKQMAANSSGKTVFLFGLAENDMELKEYFDKIICLVIDVETMKQRVAARKTNFFGKSPDELRQVLRYFQPTLDKYISAGAVTIDATQPVDKVIDEILSQVK